MPRLPLIGIAPYLIEPKPNRPFVGTYRTYVRAVEAGGGLPVLLSPNLKLVPFYVKILDGLLLTGGGDIHPKHYKRKIDPGARLHLSPDERTQFDLAMTRAFLKAGKPILGICLGCQTLTVAGGGELLQDIPNQRHKQTEHEIAVARGSKLRTILGKDRLLVNSRHHQAVFRVGRKMKVSAISPDQIVEGVEATRHPFAVGVQWHPEELLARPATRKLLKAFVRSC
jgi:putative glutamine amidotransferase